MIMVPTHPGKVLREHAMPETGKSVAEVAKILGVSRQSLYRILAEKAGISIDMALRLGKYFGTKPEVWTRMQSDYDVAVTMNRIGDELDRIPTLTERAK